MMWGEKGRDGLGVGREGWSGCGEGGMVWVWGGRDGLGVVPVYELTLLTEHRSMKSLILCWT